MKTLNDATLKWQIDYESNVARQGLEPRHHPVVNP
ncbi:hypothetical protein FKOIJHOC_00024 [Acinetobacter phage Ab_121]|nr:hypothetical protein FKOIJHOC_00024 [Acinetobacter phage Ab_121]UYL86159.1 hypothetical protein [Acinetobacter phage vB_AbaM_CP14]